MNSLFKKSKKAKDVEGPFGPSVSSEQPQLPKASRALTRKKKKVEVEERPVFDLDAALPGTNDFRTSLLMPNLSARFSMLREQDDPNSKLGKAMDDSVLFPKRASRLMLFNNNPLTDIAEVESIRSSFKPPFAENGGRYSTDGYASDDGSVMNRSRPGEGNNLFGGRQKLYKIPGGSSRTVAGESVMTSGKHTYEGDVSLSTFQQLRLREKEERERQNGLELMPERNSYPDPETDEQSSSRSPRTGFSENRGTQSSTNSGPSNRRTSTAATSVVSESPMLQHSNHSAVNKIKEQDANSSAESIGFASSPGVRKVREDGSRPPYRLSGSRSAVNMRDNYSRQSPVPPQLDFGLRETNRSQTSSRFNATSPTLQFEHEQDGTLAHNIRPNDRGKATAMGMFNKPARHYDDAQFQQRQMQMHEGRNSPVSTTNSRAGSRASPEPPRRPSYASSTYPVSQEEAPQVPPIPHYPPSPVPNRRGSPASTGRKSISRPRAKSSASVKEAAIVKARVESLIRKQNAELQAQEQTQFGPLRDGGADPISPEKNASKGTFFDESDYSDDEKDLTRRSIKSTTSGPPLPPPPAEIHPALRNAHEDLDDFNFGTETAQPSLPRTSTYSQASSKMRKSSDRRRLSEHESVLSLEDVDSPTIPATGLGLSNMIRHLRVDSDKSMLPPPSPAFPGGDFRGSVASTSHTVTSVKSDPFEYDNDQRPLPTQSTAAYQPPMPTTTMSQKAQQILGTAMAMREAAVKSNATPKVGADTNGYDENQTGAGAENLSHQRNESTETQREMRRFDEELAARRQKIDGALSRVHERSRSRSPGADRNGAGNSQGHGFSLPRLPGRSNTGDRFEPAIQSKAMKMLGLSPTPRENQQPSPRMPPGPMDDYAARNMARNGQRTPSAPLDDRSQGRRTPNSRQGHRPGPGNGHDRPPPPRSTTPGSRPNMRDRSASSAGDRSASRNKYLPDFDRSMMPGAFPGSPYPTRPSPQNEFGQRSASPANRAYERSGSSAAGHYHDRSNYFTAKPLVPQDVGNGMTPRPSPRPSPNPATEGRQKPSPPQQLSTPMSPPSSALPSPNPATANGRTTPSNMQLPGRVTPSGHRKRSVTKTMISDPTFVSSTSTVPLVYLPRDGGPAMEPMSTPPIPAMNPRRRESPAPSPGLPGYAPHPAVRPSDTPSLNMSEPYNSSSYNNYEATNSSQAMTHSAPRQRNKLRKSSSEGGNMAARARQQALAAEMSREAGRSPAIDTFQFNRSATNLHVGGNQGGMF